MYAHCRDRYSIELINPCPPFWVGSIALPTPRGGGFGQVTPGEKEHVAPFWGASEKRWKNRICRNYGDEVLKRASRLRFLGLKIADSDGDGDRDGDEDRDLVAVANQLVYRPQSRQRNQSLARYTSVWIELIWSVVGTLGWHVNRFRRILRLALITSLIKFIKIILNIQSNFNSVNLLVLAQTKNLRYIKYFIVLLSW